MFPKQVNCDACGSPVIVKQSIPVFEMEVDRPSHLEGQPKSWCCVVNCSECGQRTQYVARVDQPKSLAQGQPSRGAASAAK
jgi:DNA-directed RNA polymerase subunit RPC12/RpoP